MASTMRVAVIGCGQIAKCLHVPDYGMCPQAEIVGLCDLIQGKAEALAVRWAPDAAIYTDYKLMLKELKPDAVTVALPNYLHAPVTIAALKAGCHVNVEKPMACSAAEGRKMIETAKACGLLLNVNQSQRLFPPHIKAKEVIDSGILGKILHVTAMFGHAGPENWSPSGKWFFQKDKARFGAMADLGVHKADLVRYLTGKEVAAVSGFVERLEKKRATVEDNFVSVLKFTDGTVGTLCASWTVKGMEANYTILHCANGSFRICEWPGQPLVANLVKPECEIVFDVPPAITNEDSDSWGLDVSGRFVRAALGLEAPYCPGEEGLKSLEVILAAEKASLTGKTVTLNP
ncbi:MAG TPA: Gfo/Idh/MocA family oxidoreductase [Candidatus Hydrogenedentes bacterium]|nr:Gfo/Idh/MocA family oxidoreductase [Candidatus Hydrogenedentota bacterium]HPG67460.1 Gfo/Idh/MocA family oxidoreductase [Candidatus Hydrogenedentota bacterium]